MGNQKKRSTLRKLAVSLIAIQFSLDSCVYLSNVIQYIQIVSILGSKNPEHFLSVLQAVSAAVQVLSSFFIGNISEWIGSIKWIIVALYFLSFVGNFLYSCGGAISLNTLLVGRIICGAASASGAVVYSYITLVVQERSATFELLSNYRTSAGLCMAFGQLVAILFALCDFKIGNYRITCFNAPTFASSFIILITGVLLAVLLEDPKVTKCNDKRVDLIGAWRQFFDAPARKIIACLILLWTMFLSTLIIGEVLYFMPVFLALQIHWKTEYEGAAFMVAAFLGVLGSLLAPKVVRIVSERELSEDVPLEKRASGEDAKAMNPNEQLKGNVLYRNQVFLSILALLIFLLGQALIIGASEALSRGALPPTNSGILFVVGLSIVMIGYNCLGSSVPAIFSTHIDPELKVRLMPCIGAISGVGKLVAPVVFGALYKTELGLPIGVGLGMILVGISIPPFIWLLMKRC
ncbi:LAQU0S15e02652g1_1 [Lachancea quebecensis]|uniref:LAQU0S15e02652g1_1 n=1 Tax=Lachancea quebecensis TaxID=1654605 RepID=A0A0P1KYA8_9SACH|nr:LAQU0S15e02652g1_1 [Lachancea quebecensis]